MTWWLTQISFWYANRHTIALLYPRASQSILFMEQQLHLWVTSVPLYRDTVEQSHGLQPIHYTDTQNPLLANAAFGQKNAATVGAFRLDINCLIQYGTYDVSTS